MIARLGTWYAQRSRREQRLLALMAAMLLVAALWLLFSASRHAYRAALVDHLAAVDRRGRIAMLVDAARDSRRAPGGAALDASIAALAGEGGLRFQTLPGSSIDRLRFRAEGPSAGVLTLIARIERGGWRIDAIRIAGSAQGATVEADIGRGAR